MANGRRRRSPADTALTVLAILLLEVPVACFLWGWTRPWIAACGTLLLLGLGRRLYMELRDAFTVSVAEEKSFWLASLLLISIWCFFSGIGGFSAQTFDFCVRNPTFRDLCRQSWPLHYAVRGEPAEVQAVLGGAETCSYVYYFAWWLPAAAVVRLLGLGMRAANALLLLYAVAEAFTVFYCLLNVLKRTSYLALFSMMLFGGWDYWMGALQSGSLAPPETAEWWAGYFSYSSHTTQLYNVFHASLPVWLIVCLLLLLRGNRCKGAVGALCFAYNPFATLAMVPLTLYACCVSPEGSRREKLRQTASFWNLAAAVFLLAVFGPFYLRTLSNAGPKRYEGIVFLVWRDWRVVACYGAFLLSEVLVYFLAMGRAALGRPYARLTLVLLCLIPVLRMGYYNDFALKTPIPLLFLLMILVLKRYYGAEKRWRKAVLLLALLMGFMTSFVEINRNFRNTLNRARADYVYQPFDSYAALDIGLETENRLFASQYLAADREDDPWLRHIERR